MNLLEQCRLKMEYLWIALGSALGGVARYWLSGKTPNLTPPLSRRGVTNRLRVKFFPGPANLPLAQRNFGLRTLKFRR